MKNIFLMVLLLMGSFAEARTNYNVHRMNAAGNLDGWGPIDVSQSAAVTGALGFANGGTNATTRQSALDALMGAVTNATYLRCNGSNCVPNTIQAADVPTLNQSTTGTASNVTGTVVVANGGTGLATLTLNNVILGNGTSNPTFVAPSTSGNVLTSNGTTWTSAAPAASGGNLNASFSLNGATVPFVNIGGHIQISTQSLTAVNIGMLNSGTSGSTQIRVNQYRTGSLLNSATATLSASSGNPSAAVGAALSGTLSLLSGDYITVDVVSVAGGNPESITVEY